MENTVLIKVDQLGIPGVKWQSGKVRDWVDVGLGQRLIVSTDRISAFDLVLPSGVPGKGRVLNRLSLFWRNYFWEKFPEVGSDLVSATDETCSAYLGVLTPEQKEVLVGRMMLVRKVLVVPAEAVVRGYASGSIWDKYAWTRARYPSNKVHVWDHELPFDLEESGELLEPIFTPTTKAPQGEHDMPLRFSEMEMHIETWLEKHPEIQRKTNASIISKTIRSASLDYYKSARAYAQNCGIIIADTKLEFGIDPITGELCLIDEVFTPDSSRFWSAAFYKPGCGQSSFDKQPVRDWLVDSGWNKQPPAPVLPQEVVQATINRYLQVFKMLTGRKL